MKEFAQLLVLQRRQATSPEAPIAVVGEGLLMHTLNATTLVRLSM